MKSNRGAKVPMLPLILLAVILILLVTIAFSLVQNREPSFSAGEPVRSAAHESTSDMGAVYLSEALSSKDENFQSIPEDWMDNGIFSDSYTLAYARLQKMSLEDKVGQIFLSRCPQSGAAELITQYHPGGFVLFREDFQGKNREQVIEMIASFQAASDIPMLMAVDEEGGEVVRISSNPQLAEEPFRSPMQLYREGGLEAIRADAGKKAELLTGLGLNLNLAPVCDVSTQPKDYIYSRTLGKGAGEVSAYAAAVVQTSQAKGLSSALKHFPGYGNNRDTHTGLSVDKRSMESFEANDFPPFQAGIEAGAEAVLISHNIVECIDAEYPASLSPEVHKLLRGQLGFTGLCLTDDLKMEGVLRYSREHSPVVMALLAGNDLLVTSDFTAGRDSLLRALEDGTLSEEMLDRAVFRVLAMKYHTGLLEAD